jgi:hypothetical protein
MHSKPAIPAAVPAKQLPAQITLKQEAKRKQGTPDDWAMKALKS